MYPKCDFWTSHAKKLICTKFQLDRSFRPEVIKENKLKMADFGPDKVFCPNFQIAISQEPLGVRSLNFQSFHISMIPINSVKMKKF